MDSFANNLIDEPVLESLPNGSDVSRVVVPLFQVTYINSSGFGVYVCEDKYENQFTIKGSFVSPLILGQTYKVDGKVSSYSSRYGMEKQISVEKVKNVKPLNKKGIISYLQTLKGLKQRAYDIYDMYGDSSIEILIDDPMQIANTVKGVGKKSVMDWKEQLEKMKDSQEAITALLGYGLTVKQSKELYTKYGDSVVKRIEDNPYMLSREVRGFGFLSCDIIARNIGYPLKSSHRLQEGIIHILEESTNKGHCYLPENEVLQEAIELLEVRLSEKEMFNIISNSNNDKALYKIGLQSYEVDINRVKDLLESNKYNINKKQKGYLIVDILNDELINEVKMLVLQNRIVVEDDRVYLEKYHSAENIVSMHVNRIVKMEKDISWNIIDELDNYCIKYHINLEDKQREAVLKFSKSTGGFFVLNGHAGCGKTYTLKIILEMLNRMYESIGSSATIELLAPTGKAAKVATSATGIECKTIHRGLGYNPEFGFEFDSNNPLIADIIIVDESSMLDILLAKSLFQAVKNGAKVILLGDTKQLPSVGAGNVLKDLIESNKVVVVTLDVIKRQQGQSGIIKNANAIISGNMIENRIDTGDAYIIERNYSKGVIEGIIESVKRIQNLKGYSLEDIQILCPQRGGSIGVEHMNYVLQGEFNPKDDRNKVLNKRLAIRLDHNKNEVNKIELYFKTGDKVIHIKNNYDIPWYKKVYVGVDSYYKEMGEGYVGITNGECGVIEEIIKEKDSENNTITKVVVCYEDKYIIYEDGVLELDHAYALTIHKSQGSQWPAVISPMMMQNYVMLDNNLFYTAYTRAQSFVVTVGEPRAIEHAINTHRSRKRYTSLKKLLVA